MCKKVLKGLWWCSKWYLKLTVLYWAFIGMAEAAWCAGIANPYLNAARKTKNWKLHRAITNKCNNMIFEKAIKKWKEGLGLNGKMENKPEESEEKKEPEA